MSVKGFAFRLIFAALFLLTGVSLLAYILFGMPLKVALVITFLIIASLFIWRLYNAAPLQRAEFIKTLAKGAAIGLLATAAYDLVRIILVWLFSLHLNPFKAFPYFGQAIAGADITPESAIAVGAAYHLVNGVFFSLSYCLLFQGKRWFYGILWALGLEVLMFSVYPTWLNLEAVMAEFTIISLTGHLAYGAVLGVMAQKIR